MHLGLVFLESSLDSPEFPFLGGAFGATAWPYTPKQESGQCLVLCVLCYPLGAGEPDCLCLCPQQMKPAATCTPQCWQRCGSCRTGTSVAQGERSFLGCRRGAGWWPPRAWL